MNQNSLLKILILAQHYTPEEVSGAILATELAEDLVAHGHQVYFVTSTPSYPKGKVFSGYRNSLLKKEKRGGVQIIRVWSFISKSKAFWPRILNFASFSFMSLWGGLAAGKPDVIFSYSPPLPLGIAAWLLSQLWHVPWILRVEDLYPDTAVASGALRNRRIIRLFYGLEKFLYKRCTHLSVISKGFEQVIEAKGISKAKISVQPVWADPDFIQPGPKDNSFRKLHGLTNKFVILYAGNIGQTSCLEDVMLVAESLKDNLLIRFVVIGEGVKKTLIKKIIQQRSLTNVLLLPFQPREDLSGIMAAADVGLVTINKESASYSLPSKVFNVMASSRPILSIAPTESELAQLVNDEDIGINVAPGETDNLLKAIMFFVEHPKQSNEMGTLGRNTILSKYSRVEVIHQYEELLRSISQK
ncbi:MAG: glycosyltransferase family 4 protein [Anaerolineaceae bacterium]